MYKYTANDIVEALRNAKNSNAAVKKFLKHEVRSGDPAERFVKDVREAIGAKSAEPLSRLVSSGMSKYEPHLLAIVRYANSEPLAAIAEGIVNKYADEFNKTYERSGDKVSVTDAKGFKRIVGEVETMIEAGLKERGIAQLGLMKEVLVNFIFDPDVVAEIRLLAR